MAKVVSVHSFRGGTGKSSITASLAALIALQGRRVGVVDTDIQSPGIHVIFGLDDARMKHFLNDYLWGQCGIEQAACDVTSALKTDSAGKVFLIPASLNAADIARVIHDGYDVGLLSNGFRKLIQDLSLDVLLIDTHPGLNEETLLSIAISDALIIMLRPDRQDYLGAGVTVEVARELAVPRMMILVNKTPSSLDAAAVQRQVETAYRCPVAAVLPHADEVMSLASEEIFAVRFPDHLVTRELRRVAEGLIA